MNLRRIENRNTAGGWLTQNQRQLGSTENETVDAIRSRIVSTIFINAVRDSSRIVPTNSSPMYFSLMNACSSAFGMTTVMSWATNSREELRLHGETGSEKRGPT